MEILILLIILAFIAAAVWLVVLMFRAAFKLGDRTHRRLFPEEHARQHAKMDTIKDKFKRRR